MVIVTYRSNGQIFAIVTWNCPSCPCFSFKRPGLDLLDFEFNLMRVRIHCCVCSVYTIHYPKFWPAGSGCGCEEEKGLELDLSFLCV
jgi:hypothetical protein